MSESDHKAASEAGTLATDAGTTVAALKTDVAKFCEARDWDQFHGAKDLGIGLVTEAAEFVEIFRFKTPEQINAMLSDPQILVKIRDELSDVLFFVLRFAGRFNIDVTSAFYKKLRDNNSKYPADKVRGRNEKYNEL
jgi:NTP pyrophosphatase (non-canonical NTP hydrolase)